MLEEDSSRSILSETTNFIGTNKYGLRDAINSMSVSDRLTIKLEPSRSNSRNALFESPAARLSHLSRSSSTNSPMYSLAKLQAIKANPSFLNLKFSQAMDSNGSRPPTRGLLTSRASSTKREIEIDPTNLSNPPKLKRNKNLPSAKRQIVVEKYLKSAMEPSSAKANLDLVWYQTLKEPHYEDYNELTPFKPSPSIGRNSMIISSNQLSAPVTNRRLKGLERQNSRRLIEAVKLKIPSTGSESAFASNPGSALKIPQETTDRSFKQIEKLCDSIRDFHKMIEYMQKTKVNILHEQKQLHDFVLTFVKEFDFIAKTPTKQVNKERLMTFQIAIEGKVDELKQVQDLLQDQARKIKKLCAKSGFSSIIPSILSINEAKEQNEPFNFSIMRKKTENLKHEVELLQSERENSYMMSRDQGRVSASPSPSIRSRSPGRSQTASPTRASQLRHSNSENKDSLAKHMTFSHVLSNFNRNSKRTSDKHSEAGTSFSKGSEDKPIIEHPKGKIELNLVVKEEATNENSEENTETPKLRTLEKKVNHKEMQVFFTSVIERLETRLKTFLGEVKVFQGKGSLTNLENQDSPKNKVLAAHIQNGIDSFLENCERFLRDHDYKRDNFLKSLNSYFSDIEEIISSNLLKLSSLKHLLSASIEKLIEIFKFKTKVTPLEMGDSEVRKSFLQGFTQRKTQLEHMREAILFIAQQIANSLPPIEHGAELHEDYLSSLRVRANQLLRGVHYLSKLAEVDAEFDKSVFSSANLSRKIKAAVEELEEMLQAEKIPPADKFENALDLVKELSILNQNCKVMLKELNFYVTYPFLTSALEKPIRILTELQDEGQTQETSSRKTVEKAKETIVVYNNKVAAETEAVESKFNGFVDDQLIQKKQYLDFSSARNYQKQLLEILSLMAAPKQKIEWLHNQAYPSYIVLLPKPSDKLKLIKKFEEKLDAVFNLLNIGNVLNAEILLDCLRDATSEDLIERLSGLKENLKKELREIEVVAGSPVVNSHPYYQSIAHKILLIMTKFKAMLTKVWELVDKINKAYATFRGATDSPFSSGEVELRELTNTIQWLYAGFATYIQDLKKEHDIFGKFADRIKDIGDGELNVLRIMDKCINKVHEKTETFEIDIAPLTKLHSFFNALTDWPEMMLYCKTDFDNAQPLLEHLAQIKEGVFFRWELRATVENFENRLKRLSTALEVCLTFFELGKTFNADILAKVLTPQIKIDKTQFVTLLVDLEEATEKMHIKTEISKKHVDRKFGDFMVSTVSFLKLLNRFLLDLQEKYSNVPKVLEAHVEQNKGSFVEAIKCCCVAIKNTSSEFENKLQEYSMKFEEKSRILVIIEEFLKTVLERDANIYEKLYNEAKKMFDFISKAKVEFFQGEVGTLKYRKLSLLEYEPLQLNRDKADEFVKHLDMYLKSEEICNRPAVQDLVKNIRRIFKELRNVFEIFRIYYKYGREIYTMIDDFLFKLRSDDEIEKRLTAIEEKIEEMITAIHEADIKRKRKPIFLATFEGFNIENVLERDIVPYFQELQTWIEHFRDRISVILEYDAELKKKYERQVIWMRDDFPEFLRKWLLKEDHDVSRDYDHLPMNDYEGLWIRIKEFEEVMQTKRISARQHFLQNLADGVEFINQNFLNEWFFRNQNPETADKIFTKLHHLADKIKERRIVKANMFQRMNKYLDVIERVIGIVNYLKDKEKLALGGFEAIQHFDHIQSHIEMLNFSSWARVMKFLLTEGEEVAKATTSEGSFLRAVEDGLSEGIYGKQAVMVKDKGITYTEFLKSNLVGRFAANNVIPLMHDKVQKKLGHDVYFMCDPLKLAPKLVKFVPSDPIRRTNRGKSSPFSKDKESPSKSSPYAHEDKMDSSKKKRFLNFPPAPKKASFDKTSKFFLSQRKIMESTNNSRISSTMTGLISGLPTARTFRMQIEGASDRKLNDVRFQEEDIQSEEGSPRMKMVEPAEKKPITILLNCSIEEKLFVKLPKRALNNIIEFLIDDYQSLVLVSPLWHYQISKLFEDQFILIDKSFVECYKEILALKDSYSTVTCQGSTSDEGFRVDRNLIAETQRIITGRSVVIGYTYQLADPKQGEKLAYFKFDALGQGSSRDIWIYKEEFQRDSAQEDITALVQPIMPVCQGDRIKIAVNIFSLVGLTKINTIKWLKPSLLSIPSIPKTLDANFLDGIDRNRFCEVEEFQSEWCDYLYFHRDVQHLIQDLQPCLKHLSSECSGVGILTVKSYYKAIKSGVVVDSRSKTGLNIEVIERTQPALAEVKKMGVFQDMENFLQLRVGDTLIFYHSVGENDGGPSPTKFQSIPHNTGCIY